MGELNVALLYSICGPPVICIWAFFSGSNAFFPLAKIKAMKISPQWNFYARKIDSARGVSAKPLEAATMQGRGRSSCFVKAP
jgi:hypothetical protein